MERKILCDCAGLKSDKEVSNGTEVDYSPSMQATNDGTKLYPMGKPSKCLPKPTEKA